MNIGKCEICDTPFTPKVAHQKLCGSRQCQLKKLRTYERKRRPAVNPITGWQDDRMKETFVTLEPIRWAG